MIDAARCARVGYRDDSDVEDYQTVITTTIHQRRQQIKVVVKAETRNCSMYQSVCVCVCAGEEFIMLVIEMKCHIMIVVVTSDVRTGLFLNCGYIK